MSQTSFELLTRKEILACLDQVAGLNVQLTEADLKHPDRDTMAEIYNFFIFKLMGVTKQENGETFTESFRNPELFRNTIPAMSVNKALLRLMKVCGFRDFKLRDTTHPDARRMRDILSALIHFNNFYDIQMQQRTASQREIEQKEAVLDSLRNQNRERDAQIDDSEERLDSVLKLKKEIDLLVNEVHNLNLHQAHLERGLANKKESIGRIAEDLAQYNFKQLEIEKEIENLNGKVLRSPKRFNKELNKLERDVSKERDEIRHIEKESLSKKQRAETLSDTGKGLKKLTSLAKELEIAVEKKNEEKANLDELYGKISIQEEIKAGIESKKKCMAQYESFKQNKKETQTEQQRELTFHNNRLVQQKEQLSIKRKELEKTERIYNAKQKNFEETVERRRNENENLNQKYDKYVNEIQHYVSRVHESL